MFTSILIAITLSFAITASAQNSPVFVYHSSWGDPRGIDHDWFDHNGSTVTHIIHFKVDPLNVPPYMTFDGGESNHSRNRAQIIADAHARGIKVLLCIGGVTKFSDAHCTGQGGADMWECVTSDPNLTRTVVQAMGNYCKQYGYDGFDLDWESKFNATNLGFLLQTLRTELNSWPTRGTLSIATGRTPSPEWPIATINATCDYINIMLYDGNAYWSCNGGSGGVSGFHEPLLNPAPNYPNYCWDGSVVNSAYCLSQWEAAGIDKGKTNPSIAFYGWSWKGVTAPGQQQTGCSSNCAGYASYMDAANMIATGGTYHYDNLAGQAWVSQPGATYSYVNYVDAASVAAKMNYYRSHGWGGIMCFANEHAADVTKPDGSDAKFPLLTAVRNNLTPPTPSAPSFISHPANRSVWVGETATFSISATGYPLPTFQWQKNGANISGATGSSYTTPPTAASDNGASYRCIATNSVGGASSNQAVLTVSAPVAANPTSDDFHDTTRTKSVWRFAQPSRTRFSGLGTQDAWLVMDIPTGTRLDFWTDLKNAPAVFQDISNGDFEVVARFQSVSSATYQSEGIVIKQDANTLLRFDCNYGQNGLVFYSGYLSGASASTYSTTGMSGIGGQVWIKVKRSGDTWTGWYSADGTTYTQATQFTQAFNSDSVGVFVANGDPGNGIPPGITCNVDYFFNTTSPISPEDPVGSAVAPSFTTQPTSVTVSTGQTATFSVQVSGSPTPSLQWQKNGVNISGAMDSSYTTPSATIPDSGSTYRCVASNSAGTVTSSTAILIVNASTTAPSFTSQPVNCIILAGGTATFSVQASGSPTPSLQWQKNGVNISGATSGSYTTPITTSADSGSVFRCIATNSVGAVTSNPAMLIVSSPTGGAPISDDFSDATRFSSLWMKCHPTLTSLIGQGTSNALLQFNLDATPHDMWINNFNSPRILQDVSDGDFEVVAKFQTIPTTAYQREGILMKENANSWMRFDILRDPYGLKFFSAGVTNVATATKINTTIAVATTSVWIKVRRVGDIWTASYSTDNTTFIQAGQFTHAFGVDSAGVYAGNQSSGSSAPAFVAKADYFFNTSSPIVPEDPLPTLPTGTFTSDKTKLRSGGANVVFTWTSNNATSATIDQGVGSVPLNGSRTVFVDRTRTFTLSLSNAVGTRKYTRRISVSTPQITPLSSIDITDDGSPIALVTQPVSSASLDLEVMRDGITPPQGSSSRAEQYVTQDGHGPHSFDWIGYAYPTQQIFSSLVFQEGTHDESGGFFSGNPRVEVRTGGEWTEVTGLTIMPAYRGAHADNYATYTMNFNSISGTAIRIAGTPGGTDEYISVAELRVVNPSSNSGLDGNKPRDFALLQNFPNPFNPSTKIHFQIPNSGWVTISVFNVLGQKVKTLVDREMSEGSWEVDWDGKDENDAVVTSGIYLYKMQVGDFTSTQKMILTK